MSVFARLRPVSCVPYVACVSEVYFLIAPSVFSNVYLNNILVYQGKANGFRCWCVL